MSDVGTADLGELPRGEGAARAGAPRGATPWRRVAVRVATFALALALGLFTFAALLFPDLAPDARWRASSAMPGFRREGRGFIVELNAPYIFFDTQYEPSPWVEFDLGRPRRLVSVVVTNRGECCRDKAVPLVVELSEDDAHWREVARHERAFATWVVRLALPRARYVRLRALHETELHLERVEIR